jgi:hypothetical protein
MERRDFLGNVVATTLLVGINNTDTTIQLNGGTTFPDGSNGSFVVVINRGLANEEKILITSRTGSNLAVQQRGYDGTVANSHTIASPIDHVLDATSLRDMNKTTYDNAVLVWMGV